MTTKKGKLRWDDEDRDFGDIPDWAKRGKITLDNYDLRAEWHGATIKEWKKKWPFLSHHSQVKGTADEHQWELYFRDHLGGFPASYRLFRDKAIDYYNVPDDRPELFDLSYKPKPVSERP